MKTIKKQIEVMQHFDNGDKIECSFLIEKNKEWKDCICPSWAWDRYIYRIKKEKKYVYKYAYKLADDSSWQDATHYYEKDDDFKKMFSSLQSFKRLDYTKLEVE